MFRGLLLGIKRGVFRANDAYSAAADAAFAAKRQASLRATQYRCGACHYESSPVEKGKPSFLQVHHLDDNHGNNVDSNLLAVDWMCHAYFHVGCDAPSIGMDGTASGMASHMRVAYIPGISPQDLNNLLRAIGAQLSNGDSAAALKVLEMLMVFTRPVREAYGSYHAKDFALAMQQLNPAEYEARQGLDSLRIIFSPNLLKKAGAEMLKDNPMPLSSWESFAAGYLVNA